MRKHGRSPGDANPDMGGRERVVGGAVGVRRRRLAPALPSPRPTALPLPPTRNARAVGRGDAKARAEPGRCEPRHWRARAGGGWRCRGSRARRLARRPRITPTYGVCHYLDRHFFRALIPGRRRAGMIAANPVPSPEGVRFTARCSRRDRRRTPDGALEWFNPAPTAGTGMRCRSHGSPRVTRDVWREASRGFAVRSAHVPTRTGGQVRGRRAGSPRSGWRLAGHTAEAPPQKVPKQGAPRSPLLWAFSSPTDGSDAGPGRAVRGGHTPVSPVSGTSAIAGAGDSDVRGCLTPGVSPRRGCAPAARRAPASPGSGRAG